MNFLPLGQAPKRLSEPKASDHFANGRFFNPWQNTKIPANSFRSLLKWQISKEGKKPWNRTPPQNFVLKQKPHLEKKSFVQFINHATVLIDINGTRILTDPLFGANAGPSTFLGPKRFHELPYQIEELGKIDIVLVSHNHYDHLHLESLQKLNKLFKPTFVVAHSNGPYMIEAGILRERIIELDWWEQTQLAGHSVSLVPAQHWSKRRFYDRNFALWGSFVIECEGKRIFFGADSGFGPHFRDIRQRWNGFDLALLPVGAYEPRWFMKYQHMNPAEAVQTHQILAARKSIGIHHSCFQLTDEAWDDPALALSDALKQHNLSNETFAYPRAGEFFDL